MFNLRSDGIDIALAALERGMCISDDIAIAGFEHKYTFPLMRPNLYPKWPTARI